MINLQVDGMDVFAVKQACKFAKEHALKNGPIVSYFSICYSDIFLIPCANYSNMDCLIVMLGHSTNLLSFWLTIPHIKEKHDCC